MWRSRSRPALLCPETLCVRGFSSCCCLQADKQTGERKQRTLLLLPFSTHCGHLSVCRSVSPGFSPWKGDLPGVIFPRKGRPDRWAAGMISMTSRGCHRADSHLTARYRRMGAMLRKAKDGSVQYRTPSSVSLPLPSLLFSPPSPVFPPSLSSLSLSFFPPLAPAPSPSWAVHPREPQV